MAKAPDWAIAKMGPPETKVDKYEFASRANEVYSHYMSGYTEEEISSFFNLTVEDVQKDIQHVKSGLAQHVLIKHGNDRIRILAQREESESFRRLLRESLAKPANEYVAAGLSPAGILKEYRELIGLTQKPEPSVQINTQIQNYPGGSGVRTSISSAEDVIRSVLREQNKQEQITIEAEVVDEEPSEEDVIPDDNDR